jgi:hypothetical protein
MATQSEIKRPPDWRGNGEDEYTITFGYDACYQGHVAWIKEWVEAGKYTLRRLSVLPDGASNRHTKDIELLISWAIKATTRLDIPVRFFDNIEYRLPATPLVLNVMKRINYSKQREYSNRLRELLNEIKEEGFCLQVFDPPDTIDNVLLMRPDTHLSLVK